MCVCVSVCVLVLWIGLPLETLDIGTVNMISLLWKLSSDCYNLQRIVASYCLKGN